MVRYDRLGDFEVRRGREGLKERKSNQNWKGKKYTGPLKFPYILVHRSEVTLKDHQFFCSKVILQ